MAEQATEVRYVHEVAPARASRGMSVAGMVLGIVAWGIALLSFFLLSPLSFVLSAIGMPLSVVGLRKEPTGRGMAITGLALNGVGLAIPVLMLVFAVVGGLLGA